MECFSTSTGFSYPPSQRYPLMGGRYGREHRVKGAASRGSSPVSGREYFPLRSIHARIHMQDQTALISGAAHRIEIIVK